MSHVSDLYRDEAMGFITSREFDRRFDDAVEQDMIEAARQRDYEAEEAAYYAEAEWEYMLNSMNPHDRKHALNPRRIDLKGGHRHRRNYCICSQCGHWFRRNRGIHYYEFSDGPLHFCNRTCDEQAQWEASLEADVGGRYEAHYWDAAEDEEWKRKREERR